ncbi:MAG: ATP-binding protein [Ornithinimicrobium sp.]|uniref:AAA family ATPase n=1 Tax=Ornithinimicrobium sp. TaxID=1977084 RepID=UPI0026E021BF|nr:ATP-binding protein [Ornithinimicrobium sp.]MDO5740778.1 ATP-binding protein [Ornithinimicrobium sp.]
MGEMELRGFLESFRELSELAHQNYAEDGDQERFAAALTAYLGRPAGQLAVVTEEVMNHRFADWDVALEILAQGDPQAMELGVGGGEMRYHQTLPDFVAGSHGRLPVGQVDYVSVPTGPHSHRRAIGFGMRLFHHRGEPIGVMQRRSNPRFGQDKCTVEVICADGDVATALLDEARELSIEHSVLRGQVISFESSGYGAESSGITFLERPEITAEQVILPPASMERIVAHVVGIAEHAEVLRRYGQHLKRGLLLYGPPGTGKTHTVRHLITRSPGHTVAVLAGESLAYVSLAATLARALQPAIVVLEDCDLVAEDRGMSPTGRPLLFEVLDAMDGLDADADVTFLLTTNRVETLERALVQRPGRVDQAVEVPLPDADGRRRLLELYRGPVGYGDEVLLEAAERSEGMTASFMKELMRRSVLLAAVDGVEPDDGHLRTALDGLLAGQEELTRVLLGNSGGAEASPSEGREVG